MTEPALEAGGTSWRAAFEHRGFRLYQAARLLSVVGTQMQSVAIGWQIYAVTGRPMDLAWVGLAQFLPAVGLSLVTGQVADRLERRRILVACHGAMAVLSAVLGVLARGDAAHVMPIYAVLVGIGTARAFQGPAGQSFVPSGVPAEHFPNAVAWSSSLWQVATVLGPVLGGFAYAAVGPSNVYAIAAACSLGASVFVAAIERSPAPARTAERSSVLAGVRYVRSNPIVLGAISLRPLRRPLRRRDGPPARVCARHPLPRSVGARRPPGRSCGGRGGDRGAPRTLAHRPAGGAQDARVRRAVRGRHRRLRALRSFALSLLALVVVGAADMVSVVVRSALVQLATPDTMRGRVSAVNMVFIGASNELGEFESGVTAQWLGTVPSVVLGGWRRSSWSPCGLRPSRSCVESTGCRTWRRAD